MNNIQIIGRLTKDPDIHTTDKGKTIGVLSIAVNRPYDKTLTDFFRVVGFNKIAENWGKYLKKGQQVAVTGSMYNNKYTTDAGHQKDNWSIITENVEFLSKGNMDTTTESNLDENNNSSIDDIADEESELPF